jgi:hypothetical protein
LHHGHDQGRGDALARDVRESDPGLPAAEVEEIVIVAAHAARGQRPVLLWRRLLLRGKHHDSCGRKNVDGSGCKDAVRLAIAPVNASFFEGFFSVFRQLGNVD